MAASPPPFETARLESYLDRTVGVDVTGTELLADGINLVVAVRTGDGGSYVLRQPNKLRDVDYMNDAREEYEVLCRLRDTAIPAPEPVAFCADESVTGDRFLLMTRLEGEVVPLGSDLPERFRTPAARRRVAESLVDTLAAIHTADADRFSDVCRSRSPAEQVERAVNRLDTAERETGDRFPTLRRVGNWLGEHVPPDTATTLVHGDFRPGNVLFAGEDRPTLTGVLDWETAMLGDPSTELGYLLLRWRDAGDPTPALADLDTDAAAPETVRTLRARNESGLSPFTADPGSPTRRELIARYETEAGLGFDHERFYRAYAAFVLASVWVDLHRHAIATGDDSEWPLHVTYMARLAELIIEGTDG